MFWAEKIVFLLAEFLRNNSDGALKLELSNVKDSFQYNAAKVFNDLPENLKLMDFKHYKTSS